MAVTEVGVFSYDGTQYQHNDGTSFSAPLVSGVAALIMAQRPDLTHLQVRQLIIDNVDISTDLSGKVASGGRLNAHAALQAAIALPTANNSPTISGTPATSVAQDAAYSFIPTSGDVDGDTLLFSIANKPTWASLSTTTGELSGTPTNADVGTTTGIVITVDDQQDEPNSTASLASFDLEVTVDTDSVSDDNDNCILHTNPDQRDTDGDGYGNLCDGDLNNDGSTNTLDLNLYKLAHRSSVGDPNYDVDAGFNGDGTINTLDLNIYKGLHRLPPGPSCCGAF
jgi:hypothetical protein